MDWDSSTGNTQSKVYEDLRVEEVDSFVSFVDGLLEELNGKTERCPRVDIEGHSECPFAEDLYAEKDEAAERLEEELRKVPGYLALVETAIKRFHQNLFQLETDTASLHSDRTKDEYEHAKRAFEFHLEKFYERRETLADLRSRAAKVLQRARAKDFPGKKPRKSIHSTVTPLGGVIGARGSGISRERQGASSSKWPSVRNDIDPLISLGPLGTRRAG